MGFLSRRSFLASFPAAGILRAASKGQQLPSQVKRFADPLTEREIWRLTNLSEPHYLPANYHRFISQKNSFVLAGGRSGEENYVVRIELPSGRSAQLTQGPGVAIESICLAPDERSFFFLQNGVLKQTGLRTLKERDIYRVEDGWKVGDVGISIDGRYAALIEMRAADPPLGRVRIVETAKGNSWVAAEEKSRLSRPQLRPKRDQVLYTVADGSDRRLMLVNLDGKQRQTVRARRNDEENGPEYWTADGKLIAYAQYPDQARRKSTMRVLNPDTREDQYLARCTQFWHAMGNSDHSTIVGESRSKPGPNIYLLFPLTEREMTVCEHASSRANEAVEPRPVFSPDSQWVYFTSDREGTPAVYRAGVADWVEKTD